MTLPCAAGLPAEPAVRLRRAQRADLPAIVNLLAAIDRDPAQLLVVAEVEGRVVGTLQLSFIPGLSRRGALRAQIESVRVSPAHRGRGLGQAMFSWVIDEARRRGCTLVQLTTGKSRAGAHRFYERLGFVASHEGLKLQLPGSG